MPARAVAVGVTATIGMFFFAAGMDALLGSDVNWVLAALLSLGIGVIWAAMVAKRLRSGDA